MNALGAAIVEGDLMKPETLLQVCEGVDVVVSAVGNNQATVPGQKNLIDAAKQQGVKRFIPSDYSVDYRKLDYGDNDNLDMRKEVFEYLQLMGLKYTLILNGAFMDNVGTPYMPQFDFENNAFQYWSDGETPLDFTTTDDTAKYVAEAVSDPDLENTALEITGEVLTAKQLKAEARRGDGQQAGFKAIGQCGGFEGLDRCKKTVRQFASRVRPSAVRVCNGIRQRQARSDSERSLSPHQTADCAAVPPTHTPHPQLSHRLVCH